MDSESVDMWRPTTPLISLRAADDRLFLASDDQLMAVTEHSKQIEWQFSVSGTQLMHAPVSNGESVFVGTDNGTLYALDIRTGREVWTFEADHAIYGAPAVQGDDLFVGSHDGRVYALDARDGRERWRYDADGGISATPTVAADTIYVGGDSHEVATLRRRSGFEEWRYDARGPVDVGPVLVDDVLYVGTHPGTLHVLDRGTGTSLAARSLGRSPCRGMVREGETLVVSAGDTAFGFDVTTRRFDVAWQAQFGAEVGVPTATDGVVYCVTYDGTVTEIDVSSGRVNWEFDTERSIYARPSVAGETLYVGSEEGYLYTVPIGGGADETSVYVPEGHDGAGSGPKQIGETPASSGSSETEVFTPGADTGQETRYCSACGAAVDPGDSYCSSCGEKL